MEMVPELPGTTFSNPAQRGSYDSEARVGSTPSLGVRWAISRNVAASVEST